jgi:hypothetical protein
MKKDDAKPPTTPITIPPTTPTPAPQHNNNGALIGGLVGGILGFLLLLSLLAWLLYFCFRRRNKRNSRKCQTINIEANSSSSIVYPNLASNSQIMYCNTADKASQFSNQIEISNMDNASCCGHGNAIIHHHCHNAVPETYLRMVTIQKDCCDDNISSSNEMITTQYDTYNTNGRIYLTDEEAYQHERRDYFIHNYQHQNEVNGGHFV